MRISVASGKGGTGKTLVSTSIALSLKDNKQVQLIDCDVEEPNAHILLKPSLERQQKVFIPVPQVDEQKCTHCGRCAEVCAYNAIAVAKEVVLVFSELCHGCGACSYLCPENAISYIDREVGIVEFGQADGIEFIHGILTVGEAMPVPIIRAVKQHVNPEKLVIFDVPPGTSCPVVESVKGSDFCLLVTEPTPFGLNDLALAVELLGEMDIPTGVVINRDGVGDTSVDEYCQQKEIPVLLRIPLDIEIARLYSRGFTLAEGLPQWREKFISLFNDIETIIKERGRL